MINSKSRSLSLRQVIYISHFDSKFRQEQQSTVISAMKSNIDAVLEENALFCKVTVKSSKGRFVRSAAVSRLHADPVFRTEMEAAKAEILALRTKDLKSMRNCKAEAEALAFPESNPDTECFLER